MKKRQLSLILIFLMAAVCLWGVRAMTLSLAPERSSTPNAPSDERLLPTPAFIPPSPPPVPVAVNATPTWNPPRPTPSPAPTVALDDPLPTQTLLPTAIIPFRIPKDPNWRFGAVDRLSDLETFDVIDLNLAWFVGGAGSAPPPQGTEFVYIVPVEGGSFSSDPEQLARWVVSNPGSIWQVGNEPDVAWQSNCTPEQYAIVYHDLYQLIKGADPTALVAAGAISQPTPLRLEYLDKVLAAFQQRYSTAMPVDVWTIHNAIVREELENWGVGVPPGLSGASGLLVTVDDNDRLDIFERQIIDFRTWMRDRNFRDRPLLITEFSILMPFYYGFDTGRVGAFMTGAFDWMLSTTDNEIGYPPDEDRLVQRWAWYAVAATDYPTGNLFDPNSGKITPLGRVYGEYVRVFCQ